MFFQFLKKVKLKKNISLEKTFKKKYFLFIFFQFLKKMKKKLFEKKYVFFEKIFFLKQNSLHFLPIVYVSEGPV